MNSLALDGFIPAKSDFDFATPPSPPGTSSHLPVPFGTGRIARMDHTKYHYISKLKDPAKVHDMETCFKSVTY